MALLKHWLDELEDLFRSLHADVRTPLCFLIGAGASLSSGAPGTAEIVAALMAAQPRLFPDAQAVYAKVQRLDPDERGPIIRHLFSNVVPHIGYRCMAAMARQRPIIVVNLNWDDCPLDACRRLGIPENLIAAVNLEDTEQAATELRRLLRRKKGLLSVHVHGRLEDPDSRDPSLGTRETLSFTKAEFELLQRLLNFRTVVIGTSLSGHHDVPKLVEGLLPPAGKKAKRLWVIERGPAAFLPNPETDAGYELTQALADRNSPFNFIASPDVDFDMFMVALRAAEVGFTWEDVRKASSAALPERSELVPPSAAVVRPLLDAPGLLVGRSDIGKWGVAHQVAHWHAILGEHPRPLVEAKGGAGIAAALSKASDDSPMPVLVGHHCLGRDTPHQCAELEIELEALGRTPGVILTSRPSTFSEILEMDPLFERAIEAIPFQASRVWEERALKAYARRRAPRWRAADIEEAIERGEVATPAQVDRAIDGGQGTRENKEPRQLAAYLRRLRKKDGNRALALALVRLQDMAHAIPRDQLAEICGGDLTELVSDPWELVATIQIDDEYLRLARREAVIALDEWMDEDREWLAGRIAVLGEEARWAREAMTRWERFQDFDPTESLADFDAATIELLGPELIEPALGISPKRAMRVLQVMFETAQDAWALREVGFELVRRWETLSVCPKAHDLRDEFLADTDRRGMYALFEGLLRHGGTADPELWSPVVTRLFAMARHLEDDGNRRQVALCFDALLWRRAPVDADENRALLERLLAAARDDDRLWAACATGAAYHWEGAKHLVDLELPNPVDNLGHVSEAAALEMAWIVEWHFMHQSRNRALASRRYFRSTRSTPLPPGESRLLSRKPRECSLPAEAVPGVERVVTQMGRFGKTAGWAIHMLMNVHSTSGLLHVPDVGAIFAKAEADDPGLIWAAITYEPEWRLGAALRSKLESEDGRRALQMGLAGDLELEGTEVRTPRFVTTLDPWKVRRDLGMDEDVLGDLRLPADKPWKLVELAREVRDGAVEELAGNSRWGAMTREQGEEMVDEVIVRMAAGDMHLIDRQHSLDGFAEPGRRKQEKKSKDRDELAPEDLLARVQSLLVVAASLAAMERER
jgi:hypothetical protein